MISISNLAKRKLPINSDRSVSGRSGAWILDQNDFPFFDKFIIFFQIELMWFKSISGKSRNQFRFIHSENKWLINSLTLPSSVNCSKTVSHLLSKKDFRDNNYQMSHYRNQKWIIWEHYTLLRIKTENSRKIKIQRKLESINSGTFLGLSPFW